MPYILRHYSTFADKIFIADDRSKDKTVEIASKNEKVTLFPVTWPDMGRHDSDHSALLSDSYKKYSRGVADWVIMVDADEFVYSPQLLEILEQRLQNGDKLLKTLGFNIYSRELPVTDGQLYNVCNQGILSRHFSKPIIFNPSVNLIFGDGRHKMWFFKDAPDKKWTPMHNCGIKLLHFKFLSESFCVRYNYHLKNSLYWTPEQDPIYRAKARGKRRRMLSKWRNGIKIVEEGRGLNVLTC